METTVVPIDSEQISEEKIEKAALLIKKGEIVAFPTETVYGLGGDALNPAASRKIYQAKGRSFTKPLIVLIASMEDLMKIADESKLMPPKSTWFEPKLRSGLFIHKL